MKRIFILIILILTIQYSFGQACGIYIINYIGKINSETLQIEKIKLPTIELLHGVEEENSEIGFIEIKPIENEINVKLSSHLTCHLFRKAENLLKFYKTKRKSVPIIITVIENGKHKEMRIELTWDNIKITEINEDGFGGLFELNLNEIIVR